MTASRLGFLAAMSSAVMPAFVWALTSAPSSMRRFIMEVRPSVAA